MESNDKRAIQSRTISDKLLSELLHKLLCQIQSIIKQQFIGMYVGGSIANNSFNKETSDVDCYIVTAEKLSENVIFQIDRMHQQFYLNKLLYSKRIEASYIPQQDLLKFHPTATRPYFNDGNFNFAPYGNNFLIELFVLRENGIAISGPNIKELIKEISKQDLQQAIRKNLQEYWEPLLSDLLKLSRSDYQVFAILTMCRTLYSLETGAITSKTKAAQWAINNYVKRKVLIEQALAWKSGIELNELEETQKFIRYVLDKSHNVKL